MGAMKDFDRRIRQGGDDAIAAVSEYVKELEGEVASARACAEMMLQGTGQKLGEELARRVMDEHYPPRWIPVGERLPEEGVRVLVCNIYGGSLPNQGDTGYVVDNGVIEDEEWCIPDDPFFHVTHWMPLPEPPEVK